MTGWPGELQAGRAWWDRRDMLYVGQVWGAVLWPLEQPWGGGAWLPLVLPAEVRTRRARRWARAGKA